MIATQPLLVGLKNVFRKTVRAMVVPLLLLPTGDGVCCFALKTDGSFSILFHFALLCGRYSMY